MSNGTAQSWTLFWERGKGAACLPESLAAHGRLAQVWRTSASGLPPQARVIDLACGSGAVAHALRQARPDLSIVGVDYALIPPSQVPGIELMSGVALERLPFDDACFDGAVSQFGIEYADRTGAIGELARILRPGSPITLVMHHADSPVVRHNHARDRALGEVAGTAVERAFLDGDRATLGALFAGLRSAHAGQDVVAEFEQGLGSALAQPAEARADMWRGLAAMVGKERDILSALAGAAIADCQPWLANLSASFAMSPPSVVKDAGGLPLAWLLEGRRSESACR